MARAFFVVLFFFAQHAAADALSDLRGVLGRFPATSPFAATASMEVSGDSPGVAGSRNGTTKSEIRTSADGLVIHVSADQLATAAREAKEKKRNPESRTPTRTAMAAVSVFDLLGPLDAAALLLDDLDDASLVEKSASSWHDKPATLLRIAVKPTLAGTSRFVNKPTIELRLWLDANGIPMSAERASNFSATFVVVTASNSRLEKWEFATAGDRLYATRSETSDRASAVGKNIVTSRVITLTPHAKP